MISIQWASLLAALFTGVIGSAHCFGMCGGLSTAFGMRNRSGLLQQNSSLRTTMNVMPYQLGRIGGYTIIGAIAGAFSYALLLIPLLGNLALALRVASGVLLLAIALRMLCSVNLLAPLERVGAKFWRQLKPITGKFLQGSSYTERFFLGVLWGWLPCGMVYSIAMLALLSGSALQGALLMLAFGLGTLPSMLATAAFASRLRSVQSKPWSRQLSGGVLLVFAIVFIASPFYFAGNHAMHDHHIEHAAIHTAS